MVRSAAGTENSTSYTEPGARVRSPATVIVPMELPGASWPPALTTVLATVPVPPSVPPLPTVTPEEDAMLPFTRSVPDCTRVAPV